MLPKCSGEHSTFTYYTKKNGGQSKMIKKWWKCKIWSHFHNNFQFCLFLKIFLSPIVFVTCIWSYLFFFNKLVQTKWKYDKKWAIYGNKEDSEWWSKWSKILYDHFLPFLTTHSTIACVSIHVCDTWWLILSYGRANII